MDIFFADLALFTCALAFSFCAAYYDLKTGEIPDKFTIGLFCAAIGMRAIFALFLWDIAYFIDGLAVGAIFFALGAGFFYIGGWGGGDAKLLSGIGAALGGLFAPSLISMPIKVWPEFVGFLFCLGLVAIFYSITYSLILSLKKPEVFSIMGKTIHERKIELFALLIASCVLVVLFFPIKPILGLMGALPIVFYLLLVFSRAVEAVALQKEISIEALREGDMVVEDLIIGKKVVFSKRDMDGISEKVLEQVQKAKNKPKTIIIKWGIRFGPAFPLALFLIPFWDKLVFGTI